MKSPTARKILLREDSRVETGDWKETEEVVVVGVFVLLAF
jgi:hypothetical protein